VLLANAFYLFFLDCISVYTFWAQLKSIAAAKCRQFYVTADLDWIYDRILRRCKCRRSLRKLWRRPFPPLAKMWNSQTGVNQPLANVPSVQLRRSFVLYENTKSSRFK